MRVIPPLVALLAASVLGLFGPTVAFAQDAEALIEEGIQLRERRQDAEALTRFEQAYELSESGRALAQIALAEQALSRWVSAYRHLQDALRSEDAWVSERQAPLRRALASMEEHVARLSVRGEPAGAEVFVNGESIGTLPLETAVEPGAHSVEVRADGYSAFSADVEIAQGASFQQNVSLEASSDQAAPPDDGPPSSGGGGIHPVGPIVLGIGGALLVGGVITGALALDLDSQLADMCPDPLRCTAMARPLLSDRETFAAVTDVLLFTGGAAVAAGVLLTILVQESEDSGDDVAIIPSIGPTAWSVDLRGRF